MIIVTIVLKIVYLNGIMIYLFMIFFVNWQNTIKIAKILYFVVLLNHIEINHFL